MNQLARYSFLMGFSLALAACASGPSMQSPQTKTLYDYEGALRWNEFEQAWQFLDPVFRQTHPFNDLERERFKQVEISGYEVKSRDQTEGAVVQRVEIRLVDKHNQTERMVIDNQQWRWDAASKRFWLMSGLPNISR